MSRRTIILPFLLTMLLGAIGWASVTTTAHAGGPTSVLMTNPGMGRASALHVDNADYGRLYAAVGEDVKGDLEPPSGAGSGEEVRLTWLIHDMQIWRIDRVHVTSQDGIWLETVIDLTDSGDVFDRPARWHRPKDEKELTAMLAAAGLLGTVPAPSSTSHPDDTGITAASSATSRPAAPIVAAAVGGLVVGAAGSLLILRRRPAAERPQVTLSG
jgi:hypothetical protein